MWRNYYNDSSSSFLFNVVHKEVEKRYLKNLGKILAEKQHEEAKELQLYLQKIKYVTKDLEKRKNDNFFADAAWGLLFDALNKSSTRNGRTLDKLFRVVDTGKSRQHRFQQDMQAIVNEATKIINEKNFNYNMTFNLGQSLTNVLNQQLFANEKGGGGINQQIMQTYKVQTLKKFDGYKKAGYGLRPVPGKVDVAGDGSIKITQVAQRDDNNMLVPNFTRFAQLLNNASFSNKNYSKKASKVSLKQVSMLRVLLDILPTFSGLLTNSKALQSFIYAITNRLNGNGKPDGYDSFISEIFGQLSFIYRLTGRGQTYDIDNIELNNFLKTGAKYLIYNEYNSDNIYVESTRYLIYKTIEEEKQIFDYSQEKMNIKKSLITS